MSWKTRMTACLIAALLGVFIGAGYAAVTGRLDAPAASSPSALPVPIEQAAPPAPIAGFAPAAQPRAANSAGAASRPSASKTKVDKPSKVQHKASKDERK